MLWGKKELDSNSSSLTVSFFLYKMVLITGLISLSLCGLNGDKGLLSTVHASKQILLVKKEDIVTYHCNKV